MLCLELSLVDETKQNKIPHHIESHCFVKQLWEFCGFDTFEVHDCRHWFNFRVGLKFHSVSHHRVSQGHLTIYFKSCRWYGIKGHRPSRSQICWHYFQIVFCQWVSCNGNPITTRGNCDVSYQSNAECVHLLILVIFENLNLKTNKKPKTDYEDVGSTELKTSLCVEGPGNKHVCPCRALNWGGLGCDCTLSPSPQQGTFEYSYEKLIHFSILPLSSFKSSSYPLPPTES